MKAVILAAGLGTRMKPLTDKIPKPMVELCGHPILEYKLKFLPKKIKEVIIIIGYKGDIIKKHFGYSYENRKISYVTDKTISGTANALWQAKKKLNGHFLVLMGDDIYSPSAILKCSKYKWAIVCKPARKNKKHSRVVLNRKGNIVNFIIPKKANKNNNLIFTGLYSMTDEIFKHNPIKLETKEEWGLPQTLLKVAKNKKIKVVKNNFWLSISSTKDIKNAEKEIKKNYLDF